MTMYDQKFFDTIRDGAQASAAVVVPVVMDLIHPETVVDVGCGEGWWTHEFARAGCAVLGVDGPRANHPLGPMFLAADLAHTRLTPAAVGKFDLAVSLEVAEHLPPGRADTFIADLCNLAPVVLFSAAIPGQGGTGHVNENWPAYWVERFAANGYRCSGALRWQFWEDDRVENWYRMNTMIATDRPQLYPSLFDTPLAPMWPVVHPILYDARRQH